MKKFNISIFITALIAPFTGCISDGYSKTITKKINFEYGTPHTTLSINGNPVYVMIDTGSKFGLHIQDSEMKKIKGLKYTRTYRSTDGAGKFQENIEYTVKSMDVDGILLTDISVTPFKKWGLMLSGTGDLPQNSVAGLGLFANKQIMLDYKNEMLTISEGNIYNNIINNGFKEYDFAISSDGIVMEANQSGHKYHLILDTGATVSMIWDERLKSRNFTSCLAVHPEMDNEGCKATFLEISQRDGVPTRFGAVVVSGDFKHMDKIDGLIGNNLLAGKKVLFDFNNKKLYIN
ncbi:hypothetical protein [Dryocola sp. BD626]|uniref:hypothetical protein n=1 Tax=Dryocola sp. BD626 TaxID=3133273 RepID=UPI003F50C8EC